MAAVAAAVQVVLESEPMQLAMVVLVGLEFLIRFPEPLRIMAAVAEPLFMEIIQIGLVLAV
jgi:hypothetical protein